MDDNVGGDSDPTIYQIRPDIDWRGDGDRVDILMSPFRDRDLNPQGFDAKMQFWSVTLAKWLASRSSQHPDPRFSCAEAESGLCSGMRRRPHCLPQVVKQMDKVFPVQV